MIIKKYWKSDKYNRGGLDYWKNKNINEKNITYVIILHECLLETDKQRIIDYYKRWKDSYNKCILYNIIGIDKNYILYSFAVPEY